MMPMIKHFVEAAYKDLCEYCHLSYLDAMRVIDLNRANKAITEDFRKS